MSDRRVNLDVPDLPNENHMAWLRANGLDPSDVLAAQQALVTEDALTLVTFLRVDGHKIISYGEDGKPFWEKQSITVPLLADPELFDVETYNV